MYIYLSRGEVCVHLLKKVLCCNRQDWTEGEDRSRIAGFPVQTAAALDLSFLLSNVKNRDLSTDNTPKMDEIRLGKRMVKVVFLGKNEEKDGIITFFYLTNG